MRNIILESRGPDRRSTGVNVGQDVTLSITGGALAEVSADLVNWTMLASSSGSYTIPDLGVERVALRFNLPVYNGTPVEVSVE